MKFKGKIILTTVVSFILFAQTSVFAFQSTPAGSSTTNSTEGYITGIRGMEGQSKGMGFAETYDSSTLQSTTDSNHIDVHMQKNTEFGAMLILSASFYGKHGTGTNESEYINTTDVGLATSTGNVYGIYEIGGNNEATATTMNTGWRSATPSRYINRYSSTVTYFAGDAITETRAWKGSSAFSTPGNNQTLWRRYFNGGSMGSGDGGYRSRACVVMSQDYDI